LKDDKPQERQKGGKIIFSDYSQLIKTRQLPAVIQQRHDQTVATYQQAFQDVAQQLQALTEPATTDTKRIRLDTLQTTLDRYRFKRSQQPFDPNQLPTRSLQPVPDDRPKLTPAEFTRAGLYTTPTIKLAALGGFTFDQLPDAGNRAYLAETDEITLTNQSSILPNIHHDPATMAEISASLAVGKTVITHTDAVSIPGGWSGAGYIILDPETNVGAWKIGGGLNGAFLAALLGALANLLQVMAFLALFSVAILLTALIALLSTLIISLLVAVIVASEILLEATAILIGVVFNLVDLSTRVMA